MSFLYPRTIRILRAKPQRGVGAQAEYAGDDAATQQEVAKGLRASIQLKREGQKNAAGLPGDATAPFWDIYIPAGDLADGVVKDRDVVEDDLGQRYQVTANERQGLGYRLRAQRLEA